MSMRKKQYPDAFDARDWSARYYMERQSAPEPRYTRFLRMLA